MPRFPPGFRFGTSTAAYQIEGAVSSDGKGPSIWDTFTAKPGSIVDGSSGAQACDHYHRYAEDVALMAQLGANGYRFSISWPRIQPSGKGRPSPKGLAFYDRLIDELLEAGVEPMVTLYHWDLPQALEDDGGWLNRATIEHFADYAAIVGERFGDRVEHWVPINEPNVVTMMGYCDRHARPGPGDALRGAAGRATTCCSRTAARRSRCASLSAAGSRASAAPTTTRRCGRPATRRPTSAPTKLFDALWNGMFIEPMLLGRYPVDILPLVEDAIHRRRPDHDPPAARLLRRQLLQPDAGRRRPTRTPRCPSSSARWWATR